MQAGGRAAAAPEAASAGVVGAGGSTVAQPRPAAALLHIPRQPFKVQAHPTLSLADTWTMPLASMSKVTSIWGTPRGAGGMPTYGPREKQGAPGLVRMLRRAHPKYQPARPAVAGTVTTAALCVAQLAEAAVWPAQARAGVRTRSNWPSMLLSAAISRSPWNTLMPTCATVGWGVGDQSDTAPGMLFARRMHHVLALAL